MYSNKQFLLSYKVINIVILFLLLMYANNYAQYFGRNKVQYNNFNFQVLHTQHFDIYYYPIEKEAVYNAALMLERWDKRHSEVFGVNPLKHQPVIIYANEADFQQSNVIEGLIPQGTGGVTEGLENRIIVYLTGINKDDDHVLGHELVHAFQYNIIKSQPHGMEAASRFPLWIMEGMAEYLSLGREDELTSMWMRDAVLNNDVPTIHEVETNSKYFPYRYGQAIFAYIGGKYGDKMVPTLFSNALYMGMDDAVKSLLGITVDSLSKDWQQSIKDTYTPQLKGRSKPSEIGQELISAKNGMNLSPVISPDGNYVALISRQSLFTLDLYLADAHTGEIIKKLASSNTDSHFDAISFINSTGSWSPDSKNFAFVTFEDGKNIITVVNVETGDIERNIKVDGVNAISNLAWSPDGNYIALSGYSSGISDLFLYDMKNKTTRRLTDDNYSEIQPAWSPDSKIIAFATDRGSKTNFEKLSFSPMKIGLYDLASKKISLISMSDNFKHINPQFSPDGKSLYFISDADGISDLYRYSFDEKSFYRITRVATGISGLTDMSPALSVSLKTGRLVFTVFENNSYNVHALDETGAQGTMFQPNIAEFEKHVSLPPLSAMDSGIIYNNLNDPELGLPSDTTNFATKDYNPSLQLIYIGQPELGIVVDRFGSGIGGGVSMLFSDIMSNHLLGVEAQINGGIKDLGGQVYYLNRTNRINWGGAVGHIPYLTAYYGVNATTANIGGTEYPAIDQIFYLQRVFLDEAMFIGAYPLSTNRRVEFNAGYTRISYDIEAEHVISVGGYLVADTTQSFPAPPALNLFQSALAYVGDYSFFGFTSPIQGSRYRVEADPTVGSLNFLTTLVDYRQYLFFNPFSLAFRIMEYGRIFGDSEDGRLSPIYLGDPTLVRGYDINSFNFSSASNSNVYNEFNRLIGSKIGVFNMEFRIPLTGTDQFGLINFPYLPTELSLFLDGGVAWTNQDKPVFKFAGNSDQRIPVFSTGLAARFNILGYIVAQIYYAYPFQRPGDGWQFGFVIAPGW
jgi:Tol biopolymer transport system component